MDKTENKMKIYLLNVSCNYDQENYTKFAYFDRVKAEEACESWNQAAYEKELKDAEEAGMSYEDWYRNDYAYVVQVEII